MKFKYKKYSPEVLRPVIPIEIIYNARSVQYEVLVDSGADICIFDAQIADILEVKLKTGKKQAVSGITGTTEFYYIHPVTIKVGGWPYKIEAGFLRNIAPLGYGVVGQKGFFDIFIVEFDLSKEVIELKERTR